MERPHPLATGRQRLQATAARTLLRLIDGRTDLPRVELDTQPAVRDSTAALRPDGGAAASCTDGAGPERHRPGPCPFRPLYGSVPQTRVPDTYTVTFAASA